MIFKIISIKIFRKAYTLYIYISLYFNQNKTFLLITLIKINLTSFKNVHANN